MNLDPKANEFVYGISFKRRPYSIAARFMDFLRSKGCEVSVNQGSVHVFGLEGDLEAMARELRTLAGEFDERNGTLIANTLTDVWEFRGCCSESQCKLSWPIGEVEKILEGPAFVATGQWRDAPTLKGHRRLGQVFVAGDPLEAQPIGEA